MPQKEPSPIPQNADNIGTLTAKAGGLALSFVRAFSAWRKCEDEEEKSRLADEMYTIFFDAEVARIKMDIAILTKKRDELVNGGSVALEA